MVLHYYALKSEDSLPPSAYFIDPYDREKYMPKPQEPLSDFITRVQSDRARKTHHHPTDQEMKALMVECLYETTPQNLREQFFNQHQSPPTFTQLFAFTRSLISQLKSNAQVSLQKRQERARDYCLNNCALHHASQSWSGNGAQTAFNMAGVENLGTYPEEQRLGTCGMCGCGLANKVRISTEAALAGLTPEQIDIVLRTYGSHAFSKCWILNESSKFPSLLQVLRKKVSAGNAGGRELLNTYETQLVQLKKKDGTKEN